ncbi:MAG: 4Fe-4S binding protein [Desulfobacterales bacterium]|jgi:MinD superfamily P-loop ATPase|nr:4Fe-4S binding protein [Desulfobacterales bacterium]
MKELVVISGKGGTGKTSLTAAFAALADNAVLCDADVDAADLHLLASPRILERNDFQSGGVAEITPSLCSQCGLCREKCRFDAILETFEVDEISCEGCGVCVWLCPESAIEFKEKVCGEWFLSDTRFGPMVHARLGIAEENSGKLVSLVRKEAKQLAEKQDRNLIITDGPPGVGCPVIASIGGATAVLIVTEPTVSGLHDMERVAQLAAHFKVPALLCVNKYDLNPEKTLAIETLAAEMGIKVLEAIPFDPVMIRAMVQEQTVLEYDAASEISHVIRRIWEAIGVHMAGILR